VCAMTSTHYIISDIVVSREKGGRGGNGGKPTKMNNLMFHTFEVWEGVVK
jgi:molybdenum-dependent DNA-binding transcriptional regulator ModE